ncbi:MAG: SRPBCC family protein [Alphaproteobacteria bacterium]
MKYAFSTAPRVALVPALAFLAAILAWALPAPAAAGDIQVVSSVELNASPSDVWALIGAFDNLQGWHPAVEGTRMEGSPTQVGSKRVLMLKGGGEIEEELTSYSASGTRYTYKILKSPLPVANYESFLAVTDEGGGKSLVIWGSRFDAAGGASKAKAKGTIAGVYKAGLDTLAKKFGTPGHMMKEKM